MHPGCRIALLVLLLAMLATARGSPALADPLRPTTPLAWPIYGAWGVPTAEFPIVAQLGTNTVFVHLYTEENPSSWSAALSAALENALRVIVIPWSWTTHSQPWVLSRDRYGDSHSSWDISRGTALLGFLNTWDSAHPGHIVALSGMDEPYYNGPRGAGDCTPSDPQAGGYTTPELIRLRQLIHERVALPVFYTVADLTLWQQRSQNPARCEFGLTYASDAAYDLVAIYHYPFKVNDGGKPEYAAVLDLLERNHQLKTDLGLRLDYLFFGQSFAWNTLAPPLRMPTAGEMLELRERVQDTGVPIGFVWYPWRQDLYDTTLALHPELYPALYAPRTVRPVPNWSAGIYGDPALLLAANGQPPGVVRGPGQIKIWFADDAASVALHGYRHGATLYPLTPGVTTTYTVPLGGAGPTTLTLGTGTWGLGQTPAPTYRQYLPAIQLAAASQAAAGRYRDTNASPAAHLTFTGPEETVLAPNQWGLNYMPDGNVSFMRVGGDVHIWFSAKKETYYFRGSRFDNLTPHQIAGGKAVPVLAPSGSGFDRDYAGVGSVLPAANGTDLLMFYHGEDQTCGLDKAHVAIGLARSSDGGATWARQGQILASRDPTTQCLKFAGVGSPNAIISPDGNYIYLYFVDWWNTTNLGADEIHLARAPRSSDGVPGSWTKYFNGSFTEAGLGGNSTPIIRRANPPEETVFAAGPNVSFNSVLKRYIAVFSSRPGLYYTLSDDAIHWEPATSLWFIQGANNEPAPGDIWYTYFSLLSLDQTSQTSTSSQAFLYYGRGVWGPNGEPHHMMRRPLRIGFSMFLPLITRGYDAQPPPSVSVPSGGSFDPLAGWT